jgi:hypothetical protein
MFQHLVGIEFHFNNHTRVRGLSPFKFAWCFGFVDNLTYRPSHPACKFALDAAIPSHTSAWIFDQVHAYLIYLGDLNSKIFSPNQWTAPAANIQSFINGAIGTQLLSQRRWVLAYNYDPTCISIHHLVLNPGTICKEILKDIHYATASH